MKSLFKYVLYSIIIVTIILSSLNIFRLHPEAQFAFIFPGIFLFAFSEIMDDTFRQGSRGRMHFLRGR
ncbi:hypothetical protein [Mucilaginibacter segetis]|uniref:Uncharacterized protein n=1 Tax=Mucilaginibacter segetis TaxID=2793071 RepID=A0A934ULC6_9SPHI|nr:hypothetical protein [Mucilaginibacter segetis]MBK0377830.1 hypothetical protein [Mucilaginibacter segetis]